MTRGARLDMVTFEVLKHRLWAINDEMALIAGRISGSPAVYESGDFNTAILTPGGQSLYVGAHIIRQAAALDVVVQGVKEFFGDDIADGDMFLTNDPWYGALHAQDAAVVAPVFFGGRLIAWTGIVMHETDVGGPKPGSWSVGARNAYEECPLFPPLKLIERGRLRRDVEAAFLRASRTPDLNALNLRAKIACQQTTRERLLDIVREIGSDGWFDLVDQLLQYVRTAVRERLRDIPDGTWHASHLLDHDGVEDRIYQLKVAVTKDVDRLIIDFRGTDKQAGGPINCTRSGLLGGVFQTLLPLLCFDVPWSTAALMDCVEVISEPGTINNALFPAATSMATVNACQATGSVLWNAMANMYGWSTALRGEMMALGHCGSNRAILSGIGESGRFVHLISDPVGGGGARSFADGVDTCGNIASPAYAMPNVERMESLMPVLYVYRKERAQTAGAGKHRGGVSLEMMVIPHGTNHSMEVVFFANGAALPEANGLFGGYPGSLQRNLILRQAGVRGGFQRGQIPGDVESAGYSQLEVAPAKAICTIGPGDAWVNFSTGGGGYGDPLDRDPGYVVRDVRRVLCTADDARELYGVVLEGSSFDAVGTERLREGKRRERLRSVTDPATSPSTSLPFDGPVLLTVGPALEIRTTNVGPVIGCQRCGRGLAPGTEDPRGYCLPGQSPITAFSPLNVYGNTKEIVVLTYCCPGCGTSLFTEVVRRQDPVESRMSIVRLPRI